MIIKNAYVYTLEQGFVKKDTVIENGYFSDPDRLPSEGEPVIDAEEYYLIPGLVDVHFHGCGGYDFSDGTLEALAAIGDYELRNGITAVCPAAMTLPEEMLRGICENAFKYASNNQLGTRDRQVARLCGIHLEGPFIAAEKKGAQNHAYIREPDRGMFHRLQEVAHGLIRLITIAPESAHAMDFIRELNGQVHISLGHTASDYDTAYEAFVLGADHVTHCFNAMPGFTHRAPGVIGAVADASHVMPELICDGVHVHPSAVRCSTYNPAKSIGVEALYGRIAAGAYGDCVILSRTDLSVQNVILGGELVN